MSSATPLKSRVPRIAGAAVERARLSVVPRTRAVRAARVPFVLFVSVILLLGVVGLLMFNTSMQQASFAMDTYQDRAVSLAAREEQLAAELEELRNPQTLAVKAQRNGMVPPTCTAFLATATGEVTGQVCATVPDGRLALTDREPTLPAILNPPDTIVTVPSADGAASADAPGDRDKKNKKNRNR
jgi:cell division protein FtsB